MAERFLITTAGLEQLFAALEAAGRRILAPTARDGRTELCPVARFAEVSLDALQTALGAKETAFPRAERLLSYRMAPGRVELEGAKPEVPPTVLFGVRPCEAAAFASLDAVFNWDTRDAFFNARMAQLTVVGVSCTQADAACFCTSVGGGPGATKGSDLLLTPLADGTFLAEVLTEKGRALRDLAPSAFAPGDADKEARLATLPAAFDAGALREKLGGLFEHPLWAEQSLRCIGCGACAYVCPTCACFDLQEEADRRAGQRLRTWDSCGFVQFTLHASGHNPRETQGQRWRQRVYHKLKYFPERFGFPMCVGCGKCSRACPADMNLKEHLVQAAEVAL